MNELSQRYAWSCEWLQIPKETQGRDGGLYQGIGLDRLQSLQTPLEACLKVLSSLSLPQRKAWISTHQPSVSRHSKNPSNVVSLNAVHSKCPDFIVLLFKPCPGYHGKLFPQRTEVLRAICNSDHGFLNCTPRDIRRSDLELSRVYLSCARNAKGRGSWMRNRRMSTERKVREILSGTEALLSI